jgi:hypothetical protein
LVALGLAIYSRRYFGRNHQGTKETPIGNH